MNRGQDWYKREPIAFLDAIQGLGPDLIGAYATILDLVYARGGETRRDDRHLSGLMGCSMRKAQTLTDALIECGKLEFHDGFITNSRAKREAKLRRDVSETRATQGRKGGEKSGEVRKNNKIAEAIGSSKTEAEKRREEKKEKELPNGSSKKKAKKGSRIPENWQASEQERRYAADHGFSAQAIALEEEKFRNYWLAKSGAGATKLDWSATWRNWVLNAQSRMPRGSPANRNPDPNDHSLAAATQRIMNRRRNTANGQNAEASPGCGRRDFGNVELLPTVAQNEF